MLVQSPCDDGFPYVVTSLAEENVVPVLDNLRTTSEAGIIVMFEGRLILVNGVLQERTKRTAGIAQLFQTAEKWLERLTPVPFKSRV